MKLEDTLSPGEKKVYQKILKELERDKAFYCTAGPEKKTKSLIKNCHITEKDAYGIMKKIAEFQAYNTSCEGGNK